MYTKKDRSCTMESVCFKQYTYNMVLLLPFWEGYQATSIYAAHLRGVSSVLYIGIQNGGFGRTKVWGSYWLQQFLELESEDNIIIIINSTCQSIHYNELKKKLQKKHSILINCILLFSVSMSIIQATGSWIYSYMFFFVDYFANFSLNSPLWRKLKTILL